MSRQVSNLGVLAIILLIVVVVVDQWTKNLVVTYLSPPNGDGRKIPLLGEYLSLFYIQNRASAMVLFSNRILLTVLITIALIVLLVFYFLFIRLKNFAGELIFALILGGASGNIIDRIYRGGYVVDFISFRLPQAGFQFYIFNVADAAISIGVVLFFILLLFGDSRRKKKMAVTQAIT
jgi:signal peptidase II